MTNKYDLNISNDVVIADINRLTNQLWKLIPMRENNENWQNQLDTVLIEITGLFQVFAVSEDFLILLTKLEGMKKVEIEFSVYRKTVFECISLLREAYKWADH